MAAVEPFALPNPDDDQRSWVRDASHAARPVTPLAAECWAMWMACPVLAMPVRLINGYLYVDPTGGESTEAIARSVEGSPREYWERQLLPRIQRVCERGDAYEQTLTELVAEFPGVLQASAEAFALTMEAYAVVDVRRTRWLAFCRRLLADDGEDLAMVALGGHENEAAGHGPQLARMAGLAKQVPAVADALRAGRYDEIRGIAGSGPFWSAFEMYLSDWGRGLQSWGEVHQPTFEEDPALPLGLIAAYLDRPAAPAERDASGRREAAIARLERACTTDYRRRQLRRHLGDAEDYVPVIESRAKWQLRIAATIRHTAIEIGGRLVQAGIVDRANDATYFTSTELAAMANGDTRDWRAEATRRKADLERWAAIEPPFNLGKPVEDDSWRHWSGVSGQPSKEGRVVRGIGVSRGIARGIARVVRTLQEADGLGPGDVLVTDATTPMWTPYFPVVAAVVTNFGGILSHAAIEAREYGIAAVVGTQEGTNTIPDGALITVDGTAGTVTIEP